jgi:hypothetical protein
LPGLDPYRRAQAPREIVQGSAGLWKIVTFSIGIRLPGTARCRLAVAEEDAEAKRIVSSPLTG